MREDKTGIPLRVLIVEDSEDDTLLIAHELRHKGFDVIYERVDIPEAMEAALDQQKWDIILSDHSMPHFSSFSALELVKKKGLDLPFIIVSGSIGEETAVAAMKAGIHDYIMKDNIARLVPAIERELKEAEVRRERKRAEKKLRESEEKYRRLVENLMERYFFYSHDPEGVFVYISPSVTNILGYSQEEFLTHFAEYLTDNPINDAAKHHTERSIKGEQQPPYELETFHKNGGIHWLEVSETPVFDAEGKVIAIEGIAHDITELKKIEEEKEKMRAQLVQAQKMESIGTLAGGVAHDFNNILTTIQGYAQLGMMDLKKHDPLYENLKEIHQASIRAANLTRQLLLFSRQQPMEVHSFSLNDTLNNLMKMLKRVIGEDISIHTELGPDLWTVTADPGNVEVEV